MIFALLPLTYFELLRCYGALVSRNFGHVSRQSVQWTH